MTLTNVARDYNISNAVQEELLRQALERMPPINLNYDAIRDLGRTIIKVTIIEDKIYTGALSDPII